MNTLVGPQWLTSQGLLVMTDPDTPFLHVGMNAPRGGDGVGWVQRSWGVGVQNMAREYLPRSSSARGAGDGDGLLRLQARPSWHNTQRGVVGAAMLHALAWLSGKTVCFCVDVTQTLVCPSPAK